MKDRVLVSHSWPAVSITEQKEMPRCRSGVVRGKVCSDCNCFCISDNKIQEVQVLLNPYSDKNIPSESAHRIVGIRAVVKSEHGIIAPFTEQRSALAADIIRRSDPA